MGAVCSWVAARACWLGSMLPSRVRMGAALRHAAAAGAPPSGQRECSASSPAFDPSLPIRRPQVGISFSRLAQLGPGGALQQAVTKAVTIGRRLGDGFADDGADAPHVVLFDPAEFPGGCWGGRRWHMGAGAAHTAHPVVIGQRQAAAPTWPLARLEASLAGCWLRPQRPTPPARRRRADLPPVAEGGAPYSRVLVDKFIAGKLRPHQVEGVSCTFFFCSRVVRPQWVAGVAWSGACSTSLPLPLLLLPMPAAVSAHDVVLRASAPIPSAALPPPRCLAP